MHVIAGIFLSVGAMLTQTKHVVHRAAGKITPLGLKRQTRDVHLAKYSGRLRHIQDLAHLTSPRHICWRSTFPFQPFFEFRHSHPVLDGHAPY
jgi:hypothetical protein